MSGSSARVPKVPSGASALRPPNRTPLPPPPDRGEPESQADPIGEFSYELPPPPPVVRREPREQFNTKVKVDLRKRLDIFVESNGSNLQGVLEAALDEYMARRGWSWEDYHRALRRGG